MKNCRICKKDKHIDDFHKAVKNKDGRYSICKDCRKPIDKHYYKIQPNKRLKKQERQAWLVNCISTIKTSNKCSVCGEGDRFCLDFHHIDDSKKEFEIGRGYSVSLTALIVELNKCCVLCANCHRKHHGGTLGVKRFKNLTISMKDFENENQMGVVRA